ncbi:aldose epimerase [Paenibacillus chartarius]|uniref:Aldose epimerase n=1 Tax=Paenibacillus chartarius TaxID=747481 RepID=A0ABV6DT90_9BACL
MSRYEIRSYEAEYAMFELKDTVTDSAVRVCPQRGGIVTGFRSHGQELLYLDRETFANPAANIRGGIPVLFPICGQLADGAYEWEGQRYEMRNHGVARVMPWSVEDSGTDAESAWIRLKLRSSAETLASYPFDFELEFTYTLQEGKLTIAQSYRNVSDREMPMYAGFHPYFAADRKALAYDTDAKTMYDYNDLQTKPYEGTVDLEHLTESVALVDAAAPRIAFQPLEGVRVELTYSGLFRYVVLWSVPGKPFVCVEPWMAKNGALQTGEGLTLVGPHRELQAEFTIERK